MTGFEPRTSGLRSDRSTNWATTTAHSTEVLFEKNQKKQKEAGVGKFSFVIMFRDMEIVVFKTGLQSA